jgi:hypothetical protein
MGSLSNEAREVIKSSKFFCAGGCSETAGMDPKRLFSNEVTQRNDRKISWANSGESVDERQALMQSTEVLIESRAGGGRHFHISLKRLGSIWKMKHEGESDRSPL